MEFEAEKEKRWDEREKWQAEQFAQMMNMMFAHNGQSSQPMMNFSQMFNQPDASTSTSTFTNSQLPPNSDGMNLGNDDTSTGLFNDLHGFTSNKHTDNFKFD